MSIRAPASTCAAVTLPFRIHSPANISAAPNWSCAAVLIDRHIHKNGGTAFRQVLRLNQKLGRCTYVGMTMREDRIHQALGNGSHVCVEHHNGGMKLGFWETVAAMRMMPLAAGGCTGVRVVLRIREPFAWYVSWYLWGPAYNGRVRLNATTLPANLQSRIILGIVPHGFVPNWGRSGLSKCGECGPLTSVEHKQLKHALSLVDILAPMDRYDEMVVLLTQVVGDWVATSFVKDNVNRVIRPSRGGIGGLGPDGPLDLRNASDLCGEDDPRLPRCRGLVRSLAADDEWLYQTAVGRFALQLQQAEASPAWAALLPGAKKAVAGGAQQAKGKAKKTAKKSDKIKTDVKKEG